MGGGAGGGERWGRGVCVGGEVGGVSVGEEVCVWGGDVGG